jgi:hypothetical protein
MQIVSANSSLQREWHGSSFVPLTVYKETREIQNLADQAQIFLCCQLVAASKKLSIRYGLHSVYHALSLLHQLSNHWSQVDKFDSHDNEFPIQIAQLKDAMLKKYSEIEWPLQSLMDLSPPVESCLGQGTFKFKPVTASIWCISTHPGSLPHSSNTLTDAANKSAEENSYCKSIDYV